MSVIGIGVLSQQTGVNIETIRYYERIAILPPPPRTEGGHRIYGEEHLKRLKFVRRSRELVDRFRRFDPFPGGHY